MKKLIQEYLSSDEFTTRMKENYGEESEIILSFNYGSQFFGLATENSDYDIQVIVKPSVEFLILQKEMRNYVMSTVYKGVEIDIQVKSIQNFIRELSKGTIFNLIFLTELGKSSDSVYIEHELFHNFLDRMVTAIKSSDGHEKVLRDSLLGQLPKQRDLVYPPKTPYFPHKFYMCEVYFTSLKQFMRGQEITLEVTEYQKEKIKYLKSVGLKQQHIKNKEVKELDLTSAEHIRLKNICESEYEYVTKLEEELLSYFDTFKFDNNVKYSTNETMEKVMPFCLEFYNWTKILQGENSVRHRKLIEIELRNHNITFPTKKEENVTREHRPILYQ